MQLNETTAEQRQAIDRMIALCRRMVEVMPPLDGIGVRSIRAPNGPV